MKEILGQTFGKWTIIGEAPKNLWGKRQYQAQCQCGFIKVARKDYFINGLSSQCQQCALNATRTRGYSPGDKMHNWTIIAEAKNHWSERFYLCRYICGKEKNVRLRDLKRNKSTQCTSCKVRQRNYTHKDSRSSTHRIWAGIKQRCLNPKNQSYKWYGGRGIKLDPRWYQYENFLQDMGRRPDGMTIDRIDPDGHYEPVNCKWVSPLENHQNRRNSSKYFDSYMYVKKDKLCNECINKFPH